MTATARVAVVASPVVLLTAMVFAFRNGDDPLGPSPAVAAAVTGFLMLALSTIDAAWADFQVRSRRAVRSGLRGAGYLALGLATALGVSWLGAPTWIGPAVAVFAVVVWFIDERIGGAGDWLSNALRLVVVGGALGSVPFTGPAIAVLTAVTILAMLWLLDGHVVVPIQRFVGDSVTADHLTNMASWAPAALGAFGLYRLEYPVGGWLLLAATLVSVLTRWFPRRAGRLGVHAGYQGLAMAVTTFAYAIVHRPVGSGDPWFVVMLFGISVVAAMSSAPWSVRGWVALAASLAGVLEAAPEPYTFEVVAVASLVAGLALVAVTQVRRFGSEAIVNSLYGHVSLTLAAAFSLATEVWSLVLVIGAALTAVHLVEASLSERGRLAWVSVAVRQLPTERTLINLVPTVFASGSFVVVLIALWQITGISFVVAAAMTAWAVAMAALMSQGLGNRAASRASVHVFVAGGVALGATGFQGWVVTLIGSLALVLLFVAAQRSVDLYVSIAGVGVGITQLVAERGDIGLVLMTLAAYGAVLILGTSVWAAGSGSRDLTAMRRPFIHVGAAMIAAGSITMVTLALGDQNGVMVSRLSTGLTVLGAAAVVGIAGFVFAWRWSAAVVAGALPIGYLFSAWSVTDTPFNALTIAPIIVVLVLLALTLPGRETLNPMASPASAMMLSAMATSTLASLVAVYSPNVSWSILMVAAVVAFARFLWQIVGLRYVAVALVLLAGGAESPEMFLLSSILVLALTLWWEPRTIALEAVALRWAASALVATALVLAVEVFDVPTGIAGIFALSVGAGAIVVSVVIGTTERVRWISRWWPQIAVLGRVGTVGGVLAMETGSETAGFYGLAAWNGFEAAVVARYAVARSRRWLAWLAATLAVTTGLVFAYAAATPVVPTAFMWWFIGLAGLVAWTALGDRGTRTIWDAPLGSYAHIIVAMSAAVVVLESGSIPMTRAIVTASLLALALSWIILARATGSQVFASIGFTAAAASWCVATASTVDPTENLWRWLPAFVVAAGIWRLIAHSSREHRIVWERAAATVVGILFVALLLSSTAVEDRGSWIRAALVLVLAAVIVYDVPTMRGWFVTGSNLARTFVVVAAWSLGGWYLPDDGASIALLVLVTIAGAAVAVLSASRSTEGVHRDTWMWIGLHAGAALSAVAVFGWPSPVAVFVLLVIASSTVGYGVLSGSRRWSMAGVEGFIVIAAALALEGGSVTLVSGTVVGSFAVLIATETERLIATARDDHPDDWVRAIEWLALVVVPAVTIASALKDLGYVPLLAGFGAVTLLWGIQTEVRRRVFTGALSITAAVVLAVATPIAEAISVGMATAGAVGITFAIGVLVIVVAILIERYQQSVGVKLTRLTDAMADWE